MLTDKYFNGIPLSSLHLCRCLSHFLLQRPEEGKKYLYLGNKKILPCASFDPFCVVCLSFALSLARSCVHSVRHSFALLGSLAGQEKPFARSNWVFSQKFISKDLEKVSAPFRRLALEVQEQKFPDPPSIPPLLFPSNIARVSGDHDIENLGVTCKMLPTLAMRKDNEGEQITTLPA